MFLTSIRLAWFVLVLVWTVAGVSAKRTIRAEAISSRLTHIAILTLAVALLFLPSARIGILRLRLLPQSRVVSIVGCICTWIGIAFAIWARYYLGRNWSAIVTIKQDHKLIRTGPYAFVRHPIYSGLLLAMVGTALEARELGGFVSVVITFLSWSCKCAIEEAFLLDRFHGAYALYRQEVSALIPFVLITKWR